MHKPEKNSDQEKGNPFGFKKKRGALHQISPEKNFFKSRLEREKYQGNDYQYKEVDRIKLEQNIRIV